jgi:hypothetical protein
MMKWNLTLYQDAKSFPAEYRLICTYGMDKQGTRGFTEGARTMELKGKWIIERGIHENAGAVVYKLITDNPSISLSFLKPDENILHLLDTDKHLMRGNGAWSYTLNRINPVNLSSNKFDSQKIMASQFANDSAVFDGRTPCYEPILALTGRTITGCQLIKCRLVLYQDVKTHEPTSFVLYTVHVGTGNSRYPTTGKWMVTQGTKTDRKAILYQLQPDLEKPRPPLVFLKADDNILFLLDKEMNCMAGNDYCAYTLNKK